MLRVARGKMLFQREADSGNKKAGKKIFHAARRVIIKLIAGVGRKCGINPITH